MKRTNLIFAALLLAVFFIALLNGSGAMSGTKETEEEGRLVGFIATREHLDLDELRVSATGNFVWETGRLYAEESDAGWDFPGVEGDGIFCVNVSAREDALYPDDTPMVINYGSIRPESRVDIDGDTVRVTLCGEVYVAAGGYFTYYCNPVYQLADGRVYLTAGQGIASDTHYAGEEMSTTLSYDAATTMNGKRTQYTCEAKLTVTTLGAPEKFTVTHMSADDSVLAVEEFLPDVLPESITPAEGAAYVIGEARSIDGDGTRLTDYAIDTRGTLSDGHPTHTLAACAVEDGRLVKRYIPVAWEEAEE